MMCPKVSVAKASFGALGAALCLLLALLLVSGCDRGSGVHNPQDPFEPINRRIYEFNDMLDRAVLKPVALDYLAVVPAPARTMVSNFFSNLDDVTVTLNDMLQFKPAQAMADFWRVLTNTTLGVFGLVDTASASGFEKHHEDFGQTLGHWGVESGPYVMLPLFGPSSVRDGIGFVIDHNLSPLSTHHPTIARRQTRLIKTVSLRSNLLPLQGVLDEQPDQYSYLRYFYLQRRQSLVYDGNPPRERYEDDDEDSAPMQSKIGRR